MKKNLLLLTITFLSWFAAHASTPAGTPIQPFSGHQAVLSLDEAALNAEMDQLNQLETYVLSNEGTTYAELSAANSALVADQDAVHGLDIADAFKKDSLPVWAIVLIVIGGLLVLCCVLALISGATTAE
jgi:hypothetical protein